MQNNSNLAFYVKLKSMKNMDQKYSCCTNSSAKLLYGSYFILLILIFSFNFYCELTEILN